MAWLWFNLFDRNLNFASHWNDIPMIGEMKGDSTITGPSLVLNQLLHSRFELALLVYSLLSERGTIRVF